MYAKLESLVRQKRTGLKWRTLIVDLLKLLDLKSQLDGWKRLAKELGASIAKPGDEEHNDALRRAIMEDIEGNGGQVPERIRSPLRS